MESILVVDDSTVNLRLIARVLQDKYKLVLVQSGAEALAYLENDRPDLVLLDLLMPEMDGFETYEEIKKREECRGIPVIFLTADTDIENEIRGLEMGAVDFIRKPFVPEVVLNRINRALQLEQLTQELEKQVKEKTIRIEQLSFEIIATIASIIEARDSYTKGHSVRVAEYSAILARALQWKDEEIQNLKYIALLHDIGKVGIPDNVMTKPGRLTAMEYNVIKTHTTIGGEILRDIKTITGVDSGARFHHERYDGKGYPLGLSGEQIPVVARIICIADAYDAMNSERSYRERLPKEVIRRELAEGSGSSFDPVFLDRFLELLDAGKLELQTEKTEKEKTLVDESTLLIDQIIKSIEEEAHKNEAPDYLTGLLNRKSGERRIIQAMKEGPGCLAFIDLDNLKQTNDTMGHMAGDYALMTTGKVLSECGQDAVIARIGGDEFLFYMKHVDKKEAMERVEEIQKNFRQKKEQSTYLAVSSLSIGLYLTDPLDTYENARQNADKALYCVKRNGKGGYFFYTASLSGVTQKFSVDLENLVADLKSHSAHKGSLSVGYREFAKIYDFVQQLKKRYGYKMQFVMLTVDSGENEMFNIDEKEYAMTCMEKTIQSVLRTADVSTRFGGEQFLIILMNAKRTDIENIMKRIFQQFFKLYNRKPVKLSYDVSELEDEEDV